MNNETAPAVQVIDISAEAIRTYKDHSRPLSLRRALRRLDTIAADRQALMALGDDEAVTGATIELRHALLDALGVPPTDFAAHEAKSRALARYFDLCDPAWLLECMMGVAARIEWQMIDITPEQEHRVRKVMPVSRIEQ